ncbi:putative D-ribose-binding protein [Mycobacterium leprae]|uniref:D-ribose-binding protein n=3 Tax=Mycobacterium leprae TaxID=1769 RepID=Q49738_MYCLE|nr:substrate-binding domain-containing protein [Mycobacterium leprae]CAR70491.1 putative D-ribose-binding protein [Mycobacterium leprae Br4923]AAC43242.1 rbsB [Mycobacterium leprae]AWV47323.1 sugar ABC transporter substrate-binding protein [Mycobacterium leprae]OAR20607.1 sugar ABC transporter substrate-binding protein [Mycobacterium leprae 3125609]OAX70781.1 sugar ABC transporter substrate-binding protein [Mycobacterium leprae 7935681]
MSTGTSVPLRVASIMLILGLLPAILPACGFSESHHKLTIGVSYPTANSPFWNAYTRFIDEGSHQLGVYINAVSAEEDEQKQLSDVETLINQGIDGLIVTPQSTSIAPTLLRIATQANIPVVVVDRYPGYAPGQNKNADYVAFLGPNNEKAGSGIAEALMAGGGSKFLALGGMPGNSVAQGRKAGLESALTAVGHRLVQFQYAGDSEDKGLAAAENMLQAHPAGDANAIWCFNDKLCQGAIKAVYNANREKEFIFGGMDLTPQAIAAIENGLYTVSLGAHWLEGGFGLAILYRKIHGQDPAERMVKLDLLKVDKSNVAKFKARYIDNTPHYNWKSTTPFDMTITLN